MSDVGQLLLQQGVTKSHEYLSNGIYLLKQVERSLIYLPDVTNQKKLLCFLCRLYEVMKKFCVVYFGYTPPSETNKFATDVSKEIRNACLLNKSIIRLTKIRLHVLLAGDAKAQTIIAKFFEKVQLKFQRYLVHIEFFNKEMFNRCQVE